MMKKIAFPLLLLLFTSCEDTFKIHPYDVNFDGETNINAKQINIVKKRFANKDTLRIAFISDTHQWFSDTRDEVAHINGRDDIDFVIHCGDLTNTGTAKEFKWARDILQDFQKPYITLIGNHDFLGTGDQSYGIIYGELNFSFIVSRVKFLCINTNAKEYDYMASVPNFDYMEEEFTKDTTLFDRTVIVMHAAPYSDQFNNNVCKAFRHYLDFFPGLMCCFFGHDHTNEIRNIYNDGLLFYGIDCAEHRNYRIMTITPDNYDVEQIFY